MPNGLTPAQWAAMSNNDLTHASVDVGPSDIEVSDVVYFARNRLALRMTTANGKVYLFALHRDAQRKLAALLDDGVHV